MPSVGCSREFAFQNQSGIGTEVWERQITKPTSPQWPYKHHGSSHPGQTAAATWKMPKSMGRACAAAGPAFIPRSKARQCLEDFPCPSPHTGRLSSSGALPAGNDARRALHTQSLTPTGAAGSFSAPFWSKRDFFYSLSPAEKTGKNQPPRKGPQPKKPISAGAASSLFGAEIGEFPLDSRETRCEHPLTSLGLRPSHPAIFLLLEQPSPPCPLLAAQPLQRPLHQHRLCSPTPQNPQPVPSPSPTPPLSIQTRPLPPTHRGGNAKSRCHPSAQGSPGTRVGWHGSALPLRTSGQLWPLQGPRGAPAGADISAVSCPAGSAAPCAQPRPQNPAGCEPQTAPGPLREPPGSHGIGGPVQLPSDREG